jgi:hypothetical protein
MTPLAQFHFTGLLRFSWIVPYGLGCIALGFIYIPFVFALPGRFRSLVIFAGALFLAAALGVESIGGYCATEGSQSCWQGAIITEESGETIALTIFILALVAILRTRARTVTLSL